VGGSARRAPLSRRAVDFAGFTVRAIRAWWSQRPELVICGHAFLAPLCRIGSAFSGTPYVVMAYGSEVRSRKTSRFAYWGLARAARVVAVSEFTRQAVVAGGIPAERVDVILPAAGLAAPAAGGAPPSCDVDAGLLLCVARLVERYKGHDVLLKAMPLVRARVPHARLVIVGDGPLRPYLERLATSLAVSEAVHFAGEVPDDCLEEWYRRCALFVLPSREARDGGAEGYGLVFIEANLRGKCVIGGRSGGIPDAIVDGRTGVLVDPTNVVEVADTLIHLLTHPDQAAVMAGEGRRRAHEELSWTSYLSQLEPMLAAAAAGPE
jgi:phosphatidylinositol alpha-1,6-mannosyltransferase